MCFLLFREAGNCETLALKICIVQIYEFHQIHLIVIRTSKSQIVSYLIGIVNFAQ